MINRKRSLTVNLRKNERRKTEKMNRRNETYRIKNFINKRNEGPKERLGRR